MRVVQGFTRSVAVSRPGPPSSGAELLARASALTGTTLRDLSASLGVARVGGGLREKGKAGELLELALGATGGASAVVDFPHLGVELKTIPVDERGAPRESTFVCVLSLLDADRAEWSTSWVRQKLARVLWVPIVTPASGAPGERRIGVPRAWRPSAAQEAVLAADFDEIVGLVGIGRVDELSAHRGRWLQARPKAAHGRVRTRAYGADDEPIEALPRGFYLRARFTAAILRDGAAMPA